MEGWIQPTGLVFATCVLDHASFVSLGKIYPCEIAEAYGPASQGTWTQETTVCSGTGVISKTRGLTVLQTPTETRMALFIP